MFMSHWASSSSRYTPLAVTDQPRVERMKSPGYQGIIGRPPFSPIYASAGAAPPS